MPECVASGCVYRGPLTHAPTLLPPHPPPACCPPAAPARYVQEPKQGLFGFGGSKYPPVDLNTSSLKMYW